jgi:hypothetical protein
MAYCLLGYFAYQLFEGMRSEGSQYRRRTARRDLSRAFNADQGRLGTLTGPGLGRDVVTEDRDGAMAHHTVGRGVVSY